MRHFSDDYYDSYDSMAEYELSITHHHDTEHTDVINVYQCDDSKAKVRKIRKVYVCSPFRDATEEEMKGLKQHCRELLLSGTLPIAPHLYLPQFLNDGDEREREIALSLNLDLLSVCDELHVMEGRVTNGMKTEIEYAKRNRMKTNYFNIGKKTINNTKMRRFLFLDIDGVLANEEYIIKARLLEGKPYYETLIDSERVKMLNVLKDLGVEIVISSSWGNHNNETGTLLHDLGLELEVVGVTDKFHKDWICRGVEIEKWLCDNTKYNEEYRYAIVDDDDDMLLKQVGHFVKVNRDTALTTQNVERLIEILK